MWHSMNRSNTTLRLESAAVGRGQTEQRIEGRVVSTVHGATPQAPDVTADTGWEFTGWSPTIVAATGEATYVAQYKYIDYTLTINYLDRETGDPVAVPYTGTYHYNNWYLVASPCIEGYDVASTLIVRGRMRADDLTVTVYYDAHDFALQYIQGSDDTPTDTREYKIFHKDSVGFTYPVLVGYKIKEQMIIFRSASFFTATIKPIRLYLQQGMRLASKIPRGAFCTGSIWIT